MSAEKNTDTKFVEDPELDSGFLSGAIDVWPGDSGEIKSEEIKSEEKKVPCASEDSELDSGLVMVTECLSSVDLNSPVETPVALDLKRPSPSAPEPLPPLSVLWKPDEDGFTQLHIAAMHGCDKAVGILIRVCPNKEWFNVQNDLGQTCLHLAVISGNAVVTRMLVIAGASLAVRDNRGETPLHKATLLRNKECIEALLAPVSEHPPKSQRRLSTVLNQKNYNGQACVHLAASSGHLETLKTLVYYGADINCRENLAGWTALHIAAMRGDASMCAHLCERCPGADVGARDYAGRTPRRIARRTQAAEAFRNMADSGDSETDDDEDMYDSDNESLFERLVDKYNPTVVA